MKSMTIHNYSKLLTKYGQMNMTSEAKQNPIIPMTGARRAKIEKGTGISIKCEDFA